MIWDQDITILSGAVRKSGQTTEICRSFSYKLNLQNHGGPSYESVDFFSSRKLTVAIEDAAAMSETIYQECRAEVAAAVAGVKATLRRQLAKEARDVEDVARRIA